MLVGPGRIARSPECAVPDRAAHVTADVSRFNFRDPLKHALRRHAAPEGKGLVDACWIECPRDCRICREDGLDLTGEVELALMVADIERTDSGPVTGQDEAAGGGVPDGKGPLPVHPFECCLAPGAIGLNHDLRVAAGAEAMAERDQLLAQLDIVEDLAVEHDPGGPAGIGEGCCPPAMSMIESRACARPARWSR